MTLRHPPRNPPSPWPWQARRLCRAFAWVFLLASSGRCEPVRLGATLPVYASWLARLTEGLEVEIRCLLPPGQDIHRFRPGPHDLLLAQGLALVVANGIGHDEPILGALRALGAKAPEVLDLHEGVPLIPYTDAGPKGRVNPHTFVSLSTCLHQIYHLEGALSARYPSWTQRVRSNARQFSREIRKLRARVLRRLRELPSPRVATVHDGYAYLLQEFSIPVALVLEPRHGVEPSAQELKAAIETIRSKKISVLFTEEDYPTRGLGPLLEATGLRVQPLSHLGRIPAHSDGFLEVLRANCDRILEALSGASSQGFELPADSESP